MSAPEDRFTSQEAASLSAHALVFNVVDARTQPQHLLGDLSEH